MFLRVACMISSCVVGDTVCLMLIPYQLHCNGSTYVVHPAPGVDWIIKIIKSVGIVVVAFLRR
jgi:hypothetical protein